MVSCPAAGRGFPAGIFSPPATGRTFLDYEHFYKHTNPVGWKPQKPELILKIMT